MARSFIFLLLLGVPLAVAGQNLVTGLFIVAASWFLWRSPSQARTLWKNFLELYRTPFGLSTALVMSLALATALNPLSPTGIAGGAELIPGHLGWILVPPLIFVLSPQISTNDWRRVYHLFIGVMVVMALIAVSQVIWGWRIEDNSFVTDVKRAQVFYSHPLTLAYVALLVFPAGFLRWLRSPRNPWEMALFLASGSIILASGSRTAQAVCLLLVMVNVLIKLRGRMRLIVVGVGFAMVLGIGLTPNPISKRFREVITREDTRSDYPDDRLAFWHAHWLMFQEKPILGHGDHLNTAYRKPYYARLGMVDFVRTYEAHNMYIQIAVNAGLVGLILFLSWWLWHLRFAWNLIGKNEDAELVFQTLVIWMLASITQNSFQDSEPRYALTLLVSTLYLLWRPTDSNRTVIAKS